VGIGERNSDHRWLELVKVENDEAILVKEFCGEQSRRQLVIMWERL
jgi:hypothetical protein